MKKLGISLIALLLMLSLAACSSDKTDKPATDDKYDIVLITDSGTIDDRSFNQGAWEGVEKYVDEHKEIKSTYFVLHQKMMMSITIQLQKRLMKLALK